MKPARAVTPRAGDVYGAHRALPFGRGNGSEAQYAPRNAEIQPGPDYANTSTNMGGRDPKEPE